MAMVVSKMVGLFERNSIYKWMMTGGSPSSILGYPIDGNTLHCRLASNLSKTKQALVPPKPKELEATPGAGS